MVGTRNEGNRRFAVSLRQSREVDKEWDTFPDLFLPRNLETGHSG